MPKNAPEWASPKNEEAVIDGYLVDHNPPHLLATWLGNTDMQPVVVIPKTTFRRIARGRPVFKIYSQLKTGLFLLAAQSAR